MQRDKPIVLIVDNFEDALDMYRVVLEADGYEVIVAKNGQEAVDMARQLLPDLILMDLSMPVMDGLTATQILRQDETTSHIPVLALTGHVMQRHQSQARAAGCDTVLPKPCLPSTVSSKIRRMLPTSKPKD